ncbi:coiled-coil domain-containing protein 178-like [Physella acuta]|uniref:coiled-coil domain-containing protein 178-like n=1 Tax=Physella acuta TaxID=109671 RepID=UPI0027DB986F|nr:coiled-coil domain-containing protein 178-like [Physella acuta]
MALAKVVKLEEVERQQIEQAPDTSVLTPIFENASSSEEELKKSPSDVLQLQTPQKTDEDSESQIALLLEKEETVDKVYPLPENWPKISQLSKRPRSCVLSNISTPCVKKAVSYIELFQNAIDEWMKKITEESRPSSFISNETKKQLRFSAVPEGHDFQEMSTFKHISNGRLSTRMSSATTDLTVRGKGAQLRDEEELGSNDIPYLGAQDVIDEVIVLLARLENDRQETQETYIKEVLRTNMLRKKIDDLRYRRLTELPALVQREHETCIMDLSELHWHVSYTSRIEEKAALRYKTAEKINHHLKEDISFVKQHVPLVQEKLILEVEAMDKIRKAQGDTDQELVMTKQRLAKTEMKSTEAHTKAETERGYIKQELDRVREDLANISEDLAEAKMTFNAYVHQVNDINQQLIENDQELKILKVKNENAKIAEEMQATKVSNLQSKITQAEFENRRLENENEQLEQELQTNKNRHKHVIEDLERQVTSLEIKYKTLFRKNEEIALEIEDCEDKIAKCNQQKIAGEKNTARILKEIERVTVMLNQTLEEHYRISSINENLSGELKLQKEKAFKTEEALKTNLEMLRRQVKEEIHTRTVLHARIASDGNEIEKTKIESAKKKEKAQSVADEVTNAVKLVLDKVEKLRSAKGEKQTHKESLKTQVQDLEIQHKNSSERFRELMSKLEPQHQTCKGQLNDLNEQLTTINKNKEMMKNKVEEMDGAQKMMERSVRTSEEAITLLTSELEELKIQVEAGKKIEENLRRQHNEVLDRLRIDENKHSLLKKEREAVLKKHQTDKDKFIESNKNLASRYRQLQNEFLISKEKMLKSYEERVKVEAAITDVKQLKSIQSKLHGALTEYFKLSGLYNQSELAKLEQESANNGVRVSELQVNMEQALEEITQFLSSQMDGKVAKQIAMDAVKKTSVVTMEVPNVSSTNFSHTKSALDSVQIPQMALIQ